MTKKSTKRLIQLARAACGVVLSCQQGRTGVGACFDLMVVDGDNQIGSGGKVTVDGAHPDTSPGRDVANRNVHPGGHERCGGRLHQRRLVTSGVGAFRGG